MELRSDVGTTATGRPSGGPTARSEFLWGLRLLGRGFAMYARTPRFLALGLIPAVVSFLLIAAVWVVLLYFITDLAALVTWFADDWSSTARSLVRLGAGAGIVIGAVLLSVLTYTALTLLIGDPFYEVISQRVEQRLGGTPGEVDKPWYKTLRKNAADSIRLILIGVTVAVPLFALGFVPLVGQTVVPVLDATIGGWLLAVELTGIPFNRRGLRRSGAA